MKSVTLYCLMVVGCLCMASPNAHAGDTSSEITFTNTENIQVDAQKRDPVHTAAAIMAGSCSYGASVQGVGLGASLGSVNPACDLVLAIAAAGLLTDPNGAPDNTLRDQLIFELADYALVRVNPVRKVFSYIPVLGNLF
jgi:hypothetical protein